MNSRAFYDWQTLGGGNDVEKLVAVLEENRVGWCMIGGLAVNHWSLEPMATADVDIVIATADVERSVAALEAVGFSATHHEWSVNLKGGSQVSVQISTDTMYCGFTERSLQVDVHGITMRVSSLADTLAGKLAAYNDADRRPSKRQKDLLDIMRLTESHPELTERLPQAIAEKIQGL